MGATRSSSCWAGNGELVCALARGDWESRKTANNAAPYRQRVSDISTVRCRSRNPVSRFSLIKCRNYPGYGYPLASTFSRRVHHVADDVSAEAAGLLTAYFARTYFREISRLAAIQNSDLK